MMIDTPFIGPLPEGWTRVILAPPLWPRATPEQVQKCREDDAAMRKRDV